MAAIRGWLMFAPFALAAAAIPAAPAVAHHSFAMFDPAQVKTLEGTIKLFQWVNPHAVIWVDVLDAKGASNVWAVEMTGPGPLRRMGWNPQTLTPGDKVGIKLHPLRDGRPGGQFLQLTKFDTGEVLGTLNRPLPGEEQSAK